MPKKRVSVAAPMPRNPKIKTTTTRRKKTSAPKVARVTTSVFKASAEFSADFQRLWNEGIKKAKPTKVIRNGPSTITTYE